jgi:endonuclease/exonuclease/phosphatase family metal-dependent hydrolase
VNRSWLWLSIILCLADCAAGLATEKFRVATYNVENYLDEATQTRFVKSPESKAKVCESICAIKPDVIALQEMGGEKALEELQASLRARGLDLPHREHVAGFDTNVHIAILSRFPFSARRPHTNDSFLLSGRRLRVGRGIGEVDIRVTPDYSFTFLVAHLKSKRPVPEADEAELRLEEAKVLREKIDAHLFKNPQANLVVVGDFNDTRDSPSTKAVIGKGKNKLIDTRPAEPNGDDTPNPNPVSEPRNVTWTHFYGKDDSYTRIDFILLSPGMAREWVQSETLIGQVRNWGVGSDHRPIVATFVAADQ